MPPHVASIVFWAGIGGLFYLDRSKAARRFGALWIPAAWLFVASSRSASLWLDLRPVTKGVNAAAIYEEGSPVDRSFYLILLVLALAVLSLRSAKVGPLLRRNVVILVFLSYCAVSVFWSDFGFVAFKRWTKALGDFAMVLVVLTEPEPLDALKRLLSRLGFLLFPLSVLFIKYYPQLGRRVTNSWDSEPVGVSMQKNELGLSCMVYGVLFVWMFVSAYRDRQDPGRRGRLLAYGTIIGMIIWLLSQCQSTTSQTGLTSAALVTWFASRPKRKPALVHVLVLAVLGLAVTALFFDPGGGMVGALGKNPTLTGRTDIWKLVLSLHTNPYIGTGFDSFWLGPRLEYMRNALTNFPVNEAHNGYLELYLNLGWVGVCLIALLILTAYKRVISGMRKNPQKSSLFLGFLLPILFYAFTEAAFRFPSLPTFLLLLIIVVGSQPVLFETRPETPRACEFTTGEEPAYATQRSG